MEYEGVTRAVARCGVPAGCVSKAFSLSELAEALMTPDRRPHTVYIERDSCGRLSTCGGASAALAAVSSRLAPHPPASSVTLQLAARGCVRLMASRELAPYDEILLWLDDALLARAGVPVLAPIHIRGGAEYRCSECGERYEEPNPLKMHLYLDCAPPTPQAFWRRLLASLAASVPLPTPALPHPTPTISRLPTTSSQVPTPAALEALAAAWGSWGGRGSGHACLYCGKLYSRKYGLKIHIRTHTGYKPLRCSHCARRFGDPSNLNKHVRLHTAANLEARYSCLVCGAVLARRRDLERHMRARHAASPPESKSSALAAG